MSSVLDKRTAIAELFKAGNFRQEVSKSLKVNRRLVWRILKRYEETGDIQNNQGKVITELIEPPNRKNPPEKKLGGTPKDPSRIWQSSQKCCMELCQLFSGRT